MQPRRYSFKVLKVSLLLFLTLTIISLSLPTNNKAEAYRTPTCGQLIDSIETSRDYIRMHLDEYKRITGYIIPDPMFAEYIDYWKDAAKNSLESIIKAHEWIQRDIQLMLICEDNNPYWKKTTEDLENTLIDILLLMGDSYVTTEIDWGSEDAVVGVIKVLNDIKKLSQRVGYEHLYEGVILENENTRKIAASYTANLLSSLGERMSLRFESYNKDADSEISKLANLVVLTDVMNTFKGYFTGFLERQSNNLDQLKPDSTAKIVTKSFLFDYNLSNFLNMAPRAMYMTYFEQQLAVPYISASDTAFRKDLSGNLASFMVAGDYISFGLALSELVLDLYDYVEKELAAVANLTKANVKDYQHAQQEISYKLQTLEQATTFSSKLYKIYFEDKLTDKQIRERVQKAYDELEADIKDVYQLDPNVIKLYINGKPIVMPEPAYISSGTTMVPLRVISEELGVKPIWNANARTITFTADQSPRSPFKPIDIILTVGSKQVLVGSYTEYVAVAPTIKNGTTFVPLKFIANHLGLDSVWESGSKSVILKSRG